MSALKEHLQSGTLDERLDTLLSDAAAGVRDRGRHLNTSANGWMRPEIRHNMAGPLSLADEIKRGTEADLQREERALLWRNAHSKWVWSFTVNGCGHCVGMLTVSGCGQVGVVIVCTWLITVYLTSYSCSRQHSSWVPWQRVRCQAE